MADATLRSACGAGWMGRCAGRKTLFSLSSSKGRQVSDREGFPCQTHLHPFDHLRVSRIWTSRDSRSFVRGFGQGLGRGCLHRPARISVASAEEAAGWREKHFSSSEAAWGQPGGCKAAAVQQQEGRTVHSTGS